LNLLSFAFLEKWDLPSNSDNLNIDLSSTPPAKKRQRRKAADVERKYRCPIDDCPRAYGTEGALKFHFKKKHPTLKYIPQTPSANQTHLGTPLVRPPMPQVNLGQPRIPIPQMLPMQVPDQLANVTLQGSFPGPIPTHLLPAAHQFLASMQFNKSSTPDSNGNSQSNLHTQLMAPPLMVSAIPIANGPNSLPNYGIPGAVVINSGALHPNQSQPPHLLPPQQRIVSPNIPPIQDSNDSSHHQLQIILPEHSGSERNLGQQSKIQRNLMSNNIIQGRTLDIDHTISLAIAEEQDNPENMNQLHSSVNGSTEAIEN